MSVIKDLNAITEYRSRRQARIDQRREDDEWKTINGTHVMVDEGGQITRGPEKLKSLGNDALKPSRTDYDYDPSDGFQDFVHKNAEKARPIYEEKGMEGVEDEWYKTRLRNSTKNLKEIGDDEIDRILDKYVSQATARMWLVEYNNDIKPKLVQELTANSEVRNACLNIMYENYKDTGGELSFKDFLLTPIKMYRGGSGKEYKKASAFSSYTLDRKAAEKFKNGPTGHEPEKDGEIYEAEIRPIDTYGSLNTSGEMEILVPRMIAPNGRRDSRADEKDWNEELNITGFGIEPTVASAKPNRITDVKLSSDMRPSREYIFLDSKGKILGHRDWLKANRRALQKLYEQGEDKVDQDYYKGLMVNASRRLKRVPDAEVIRDENYEEAKNDGFFRRKLIEGILKNKKARNAALNIMYDNYCKAVHGCMTFEEFLNTPIKMNKISDGDVFSSYGFMSDGDELTIRPIDTFGSIRPIPNAAVMIPWWRTKGEAVRNEDKWEWERPERYVFEEKLAPMPEAELLDAIKGEAEVIKLFSDDESETGKAVIERCTDSIHRYLRRLALRSQESHTDSAFFSGELNGQLGERNILYPEIGEYQARRKQRLDGKGDDEGQWITTEHGHHVHLNEEGEPDKGNPHVIEKMEDGEQGNKQETLPSKVERIWNELEEMPINTEFTVDGLGYKKVGNSKFIETEFGTEMSTDEMIAEYSPNIFYDNETKVTKKGDKEAEKRAFPDSIRNMYGVVEKSQRVEKTGEEFSKIMSNATKIDGADAFLSESDYNSAYDMLKKSPVGTTIDSGGTKLMKVDDDLYLDKKTGAFKPTSLAILHSIPANEHYKAKLMYADESIEQSKEDLEEMVFYGADGWANQMRHFKRETLQAFEGTENYETAKRELDAICGRAESEFKEAKEAYRNRIKEKFPTFADCKTNRDVARRLDVEGIYRHDNDRSVIPDTIPTSWAASTADEVSWLAKKYPFMKGHMGTLRFGKTVNDGVYGESSKGGAVVLNEKWYSNPSEFSASYWESVRCEFHPHGTSAKSVVDHEYGHQIDDYLTEKFVSEREQKQGKKFSDIVMQETLRECLKKNPDTNEWEVARRVSEYATHDKENGRYSEFFAEAFAAHFSEEYDNEVARIACGVMDRYAKKLEVSA